MASTHTIDASDHPIKSVTVFKSSKAEVVRTFRLPLQAGQNKVEISSLPTSIDTESARVTGLGDAQLFDVVCSIGGPPSIPAADSPSEILRLLVARRAELEQQAEIVNQATTYIKAYATTLDAEHVAPADADAFFDKLLTRQMSAKERYAQLQEDILRIQREIDVKMHKSRSRVGGTEGRVTIIVMAKEETEVEFRLTYIVAGASWKPAYELHATTAEGGLPSSDVSLQYRARITQRTGEDWTGVVLTLSTTAMEISQEAIPELRPMRIRPPPSLFAPIPLGVPAAPVQQQQFQATSLFGNVATPARAPLARSSFGSSIPALATAETLDESGPEGASGEWEEPPEVQAMRELTTVVKESPLAHTYTVEGSSSVPSDGAEHKVSIATLPFHADITHVVVPKVKAVAYLQARVKNTSDYRLLPGSVHVFVDDSFVSKTSIKDIASGDTFDCALGPDAGTRVTYTRQSKRESAKAGAFSEQFVTTTFTARTVLRNTHPYALSALVVRDVFPLSDDNTRVRVIIRKPEVLVEAKDGETHEVTSQKEGKCMVRWMKADEAGKGGKEKGLYEWACEINAGGKVVVEAEWEVKAPADVKWVETEA